MQRAVKGIFITLEGIDGSGKSTQFKLLAKRLKQEGFSVLETREPGGHPLSEKIRKILLSNKNIALTPEAELLLFLAARAQHVKDIIYPALKQGKIVLCERFSDSTYAYQVGGRGIKKELVEKFDKFVTYELKPDLTLLFDCPLKQSLARAFNTKQGHDRMEKQSGNFMNKVRQAYNELSKIDKKRIKLIKTNMALDKVTTKVWQIVYSWLATKGYV